MPRRGNTRRNSRKTISDKFSMELHHEYATKKIGSLLLVAFIFIGLGIGTALDNVIGGVLFGLGFGFLTFATVRKVKVRKSVNFASMLSENSKYGLLTAIGLLFIISGMAEVAGMTVYSQWLLGAFFLILGIIFIADAIRSVAPRR